MAELDKNGADMTIEETFAALDDLIGRLEGGKGSLEDAFKNYEEGMRLVKSCFSIFSIFSLQLFTSRMPSS